MQDEPSRDDVCKLDPQTCPKRANGSNEPRNAPLSISTHVGRGELGSKTQRTFVLPSGHVEVRGELAFVTSDALVTPEPLRFGDMALFRPSARRSFGDQLELSLSTTLLAKQPSTGRDWLWQGASLAALFEPWAGYAFALDLGGGPQLQGDGAVWTAAPSLAAKWALDRESRVLLSLANRFTTLEGAGQLRPRAWLDELALGAEAQLGDRHGGGWIGVDYAVPLAHGGQLRAATSSVAIDPSVRLDFQVGGVLRVGNDDWDLFAYYAWIDRGERSRPETLLPVLDGGFDQRQLVVGVSHRFERALLDGD